MRAWIPGFRTGVLSLLAVVVLVSPAVAQSPRIKIGSTDDLATVWSSSGVSGAKSIDFRAPTNLPSTPRVEKIGPLASQVPVNSTYGWADVSSIETLETHGDDISPFAFGGFVINGEKWGGKGWTSTGWPKGNGIELAAGEYINYIQVRYGDWVDKVTIKTNRGRQIGPIGGSGGAHTTTLSNIRVTKLKCTTAGEWDIPQHIWVEYIDNYPRPLGDIEVLAHTTGGSTFVGQRIYSDAFARPTRFTKVWDDSGSGALKDGTCWRPVPPYGYVSLGDVFAPGRTAPDVNSIVCVKSDLVVRGTVGRNVWDTVGAGNWIKKPEPFSAWTIEAPAGAVAIGAFVGTPGLGRPATPVYCLKKSAITERQLETVAEIDFLHCQDTTEGGEDEVYLRVHADGFFLGPTSKHDMNEDSGIEYWRPDFLWIFRDRLDIEVWEHDDLSDDKIGSMRLDRTHPLGSYEGHLGEAGSYWLKVAKSKRFSQAILDDALTRPRNEVARNMGDWSAPLASRLEFDRKQFKGMSYSDCGVHGVAEAPFFHAQHMVRLPNKNGTAYFAVTNSDAYIPDEYGHKGVPRGYMSIYKAYSVDPETDLVVNRQGLDGEIVWEETFQNGYIASRSGTHSRPVGTWNHPCKMERIGNLLLVCMLDWDGSDSCRDGYDRGSPGALLFYDVRNPENPVYWGRMSIWELGVSKVEDVSLVQAGDEWILMASLNGGGAGKWWRTKRVSPDITDWEYGGQATINSSMQGLFFNSYEIYDPPSSAPDGVIAQGVERVLWGNGSGDEGNPFTQSPFFVFEHLNFAPPGREASIGFHPTATSTFSNRKNAIRVTAPNLWVSEHEQQAAFAVHREFQKDYDAVAVSVHGGLPVFYSPLVFYRNGEGEAALWKPFGRDWSDRNTYRSDWRPLMEGDANADLIWQISSKAPDRGDTSWRSRIMEMDSTRRITFTDPNGLDVRSVGLQETTSGGASRAPEFPADLERVPGASITVYGDESLPNGGTSRYAPKNLNDDTGYNYLQDQAGNLGWIPGGQGTSSGQAILALSEPTTLSGIDFLTLYPSRTQGTFQFSYTAAGMDGVYEPITTVINREVNGESLFRLGLVFEPIADVTHVRIRTTSTISQVYIGEIDLYEAPSSQVATETESTSIAWWKLDEGSGTVLGSQTGNGRAATGTGGSWVSGKLGKAYTGRGSTNRAMPNLTTASISAWVKRNGPSWGYPRIIGWDNSRLEIAEIASTGRLGIYTPGIGWQDTGTYLGSAWNHIALTAGGGQVKVYLNGTLLRTYGGTVNLSGKMHFFQNYWQGEPFNGALDSVSVYDRVLSHLEIEALAGKSTMTPYQATVLADRPISYWPLDESSGSTATDALGKNNGSLLVNAQRLGQSAAPGLGTAVRFDGATERIDIPHSASLALSQTFTIEMWIKPEGSAGSTLAPLLDRAPWQFSVFYYSGGANFYDARYETSYWSAYLGAPLNQWTHIVYVKDRNGVADNWRGYVNGVEAFRMTHDFTLPATTNPMTLGSIPGYTGFTGCMDEVAIYGHALTADQVRTHYQVGTQN